MDPFRSTNTYVPPSYYPQGFFGYMKTYTLYDDELLGPIAPTDDEYNILYPLPVKKVTKHPGLIPALNIFSPTIAHKTLDTVELLEKILENLDIKTLLFAQRVSRTFRNCIKKSPKLQNVLLQRPWNPDCERGDFRFNDLLMDQVKTARNLGFTITRHARGDSGLWEFRVHITTAQLLKPPVGSSVYWAGMCTKGYKCLPKGPELWDEDQHIIKIYWKDAQDLEKPLTTIDSMEPNMNQVYRHFEYEHPNMITTSEELGDGFTMGGFTRVRFMQGQARQAELVAKEDVAAKKVQQTFRKHRALRRAERRAEGLCGVAAMSRPVDPLDDLCFFCGHEDLWCGSNVAAFVPFNLMATCVYCSAR